MPANTPPEKQKPAQAPAKAPAKALSKPAAAEEVGGRKGPEPTRYGDWEVKGICSDF